MFNGECCSAGCKTVIHPDRSTQKRPSQDHPEILEATDHYSHAALQICIGKGRYADRGLAHALSAAVATAHVPISSFATCWNSWSTPRQGAQEAEGPTLTYDNLWRLFVIHHSLEFQRNQEGHSLTIPSFNNVDSGLGGDSDNDEASQEWDDALVSAALGFFPTAHVEGSSYDTYNIPGTEEHSCIVCSHFHRYFPGGELGEDSTEEEIIEAHQQAEVDETRIVKAAVIDGIEKIGHKVLNISSIGKLILIDCLLTYA